MSLAQGQAHNVPYQSLLKMFVAERLKAEFKS